MAVYEEIVGHEQIIEYFKGAIKTDKVSHAYILNGEDYAGKMMLADSFAMALQCEKGGPEPCLECQCCKQSLHRNEPDIIYVSHEKPNTLGVDDIRRQINDDIVLKPYSSRYKIYIVDEAEKMNEQAQNALLKTIEEPPEYAIIMLLTNNAETFLPTILSRCVRLDLKAVSDEKIKKFLMKEKEIPDYRADLCVAFAQGNVGKAIRLSGSERFNEMRDQLLQLMKRMDDIEPYEMSMAVKQISEYKLNISDYFDLMMVWFRDILLYKASADANGLVFKDQVYDIKKQADKRSYEGIEYCIESLKKAKARLRANVNFDLTIEMLLWNIKEN
ncbi:MAG: DNA polymerase III subunit delta [Lachnospiraceae bacterium]|nr:DNA polymerase III subunit delta [Lachnospiraceae bacterium]